MDTLPIFAVAAPGLEHVVARELDQLGIRAIAEQGGAGWHGPVRDVLLANLHLRTASRVLVRVASFRARTFHELERHGARVPWLQFGGGNAPVRLRVTCRKSKLYHAGAVAERLLDAIAAVTGIKGEPDADAEDDSDVQAGQLFVVRMIRDVCTISADSTGELLHRRGYREAVAKAPLRETLAAAMILESHWDARSALLDPFCGSGTIPIEAALIARNIAPGIARDSRTPRPFTFEHWPAHDPREWIDCVQLARSAIRTDEPPPLFASDRNSGAIRALRSNAERAGVAADITLGTRPFDSVEAPAERGWIITNPPYGVRVGRRDDADRIITAIRDRAAADFASWTVALLTPSSRGSGPAGRAGHDTATSVHAAFESRNGGIPVTLTVLPPSA